MNSNRARKSRIEVPWNEIVGYRDGHAERITLIRQSAQILSDLAVPTPTEVYRVAVLALLDSHGVPRSDA